MVSATARRRWGNLPVVRVRLWGEPATSNVSTINRSDVIRRIFLAKGNVTNREVHTALAYEGLEASDSLITAQRKRLVADGDL
jgi:hypothetical protein